MSSLLEEVAIIKLSLTITALLSVACKSVHGVAAMIISKTFHHI